MAQPVMTIGDDDCVAREGMQGVLEAEGYRAITAARGASGVALVRDEPPALLILDLRMARNDSGLDRANARLACELLSLVPRRAAFDTPVAPSQS